LADIALECHGRARCVSNVTGHVHITWAVNWWDSDRPDYASEEQAGNIGQARRARQLPGCHAPCSPTASALKGSLTKASRGPSCLSRASRRRGREVECGNIINVPYFTVDSLVLVQLQLPTISGEFSLATILPTKGTAHHCHEQRRRLGVSHIRSSTDLPPQATTSFQP
jgi:hypothetical protein